VAGHERWSPAARRKALRLNVDPGAGSGPVQDPARSGWVRPLLAVDAAVGMGLLFSLAGHVVPESCERKGSGRFLRKRWAQATKGQGQGPRITAVEFCSGLRLVLDRLSCGTSDQRP